MRKKQRLDAISRDIKRRTRMIRQEKAAAIREAEEAFLEFEKFKQELAKAEKLMSPEDYQAWLRENNFDKKLEDDKLLMHELNRVVQSLNDYTALFGI